MSNFLKGTLQIGGLLVALYVICAANPDVGALTLFLATLICVVALVRPLPAIMLPTRRFALSTFLALATVGLGISTSALDARKAEANLRKEEMLVNLKATDPEAYLAELEQGEDRSRWFRELKLLAPERYDDAIAKAAAEAREREEQTAAARANERAATTTARTSGCKEGDMMASVMASRFVERALRSPSTAKFGPHHSAVVLDLQDCQYAVRNYVDSQNGFGATVRQYFTIEMARSEGTNNWSSKNLSFD